MKRPDIFVVAFFFIIGYFNARKYIYTGSLSQQQWSHREKVSNFYWNCQLQIQLKIEYWSTSVSKTEGSECCDLKEPIPSESRTWNIVWIIIVDGNPFQTSYRDSWKQPLGLGEIVVPLYLWAPRLRRIFRFSMNCKAMKKQVSKRIRAKVQPGY